MGRRKNQLIPFEESKRVIYLEKWGRTGRGHIGALVFGVLSVLCLLYFLAILLFMGFGTYFFLIWGVMGVGFGGIALVLGHKSWMAHIPRWFKRIAVVLFFTGLVIFGAVEGMIMTQFFSKAQPGADYCIVLGAQWKKSGPSEVLRRRLEAAAEYLRENPGTQVIVSGGQGSNEPVSEAQGMRDYLVDAGIDGDRIQMEDRSTNTIQNLVYSGELLDKENNRVVLVTNNFHTFRAMAIARKQGYAHVQGLSAPGFAGMLPHNMLREFFGVVKDFMMGNL